MFKLIFKFSIINSVLKVLFASIPPTFAAALMIKSGLVFLIVLFVSSKENKSVSSLVDSTTSVIILDFINFLTTAEPTRPLLPKTNALIFHLV
tara:strand:+ start:919 stop:1197 length:279 start_codon:yes stop_codon:yes gene_type:complete